VLAADADICVAVDHGVCVGEDRHVLGVAAETQEEDVAGLAGLAVDDALEIGLGVERGLELAGGRGAAVTGDIEGRTAERAGDFDGDASDLVIELL